MSRFELTKHGAGDLVSLGKKAKSKNHLSFLEKVVRIEKRVWSMNSEVLCGETPTLGSTNHVTFSLSYSATDSCVLRAGRTAKPKKAVNAGLAKNKTPVGCLCFPVSAKGYC